MIDSFYKKEERSRLNHIVFIVPPVHSHRTSEESLGVGYLAAVLRQNNYIVTIIDGWLQKKTNKEVVKEILSLSDILFIGISTYMSNVDNTKEIIKFLKKDIDVPIVAGGFGPSFFPKEFLEIGVDIVIRGDGENPIRKLASSFKNDDKFQESITGLAYKKDNIIVNTPPAKQIIDLDSIPFPARDTLSFAMNRKSSINILSSRGCKGDCSFCSVIAFQKLNEGQVWRQRSIKNFVDELEMLYNKGADFFKVIDDSFIEPPRDLEWCKQLAEEINSRNIHIRMRGSIKAARITDDIMYYLKKAGFYSFSCGIENFSDTALKRLSKGVTVEKNREALDIFKKYDIYVQCGLILFDPYTTVEELRDNYKYMKEYDWVITKGIFTQLFAAEGTRFTEKVLKKNNIVKQRKNENFDYEIQDKQAKKIYIALKIWHENHMKIYDMVIDPLSAPKNISQDEMKSIYSVYSCIHEKDLDFFGMVLGLPEDLSEQDIINYTNKIIDENAYFYEKIERDAIKLYESFGLSYDGTKNKYL